MPENDLRPWAPGCMVVEVLSQRPAAPWQPVFPQWIAIELESREVINRTASQSFWRNKMNPGTADG